jgi:GNAT superfamily N-acetyltransferase
MALMEFRRASEADLPGEFAVFCSAMKELHDRRGAPGRLIGEYDPTARWAGVHRHLLLHDAERSYVAVEDERLVGFAAAWVRDDCWFFSDLFVDPDCQGRGIGRELLARVWGGTHRRRTTITESIQPISTGLYASRGMLPITPVLEISGRPTAQPVGELDAVPPSGEALRAIDLAAYGFDRRVDHEFWGRASSHKTVWVRHGDAVAYSYREPGVVGPVAGRDAESAALALRAELARDEDSIVVLQIPGTSTALIEVALAAGLRFAREPGLLLLSPADSPPPKALVIRDSWLY